MVHHREESNQIILLRLRKDYEEAITRIKSDLLNYHVVAFEKFIYAFHESLSRILDTDRNMALDEMAERLKTLSSVVYSFNKQIKELEDQLLQEKDRKNFHILRDHLQALSKKKQYYSMLDRNVSKHNLYYLIRSIVESVNRMGYSGQQYGWEEAGSVIEASETFMEKITQVEQAKSNFFEKVSGNFSLKAQIGAIVDMAKQKLLAKRARQIQESDIPGMEENLKARKHIDEEQSRIPEESKKSPQAAETSPQMMQEENRYGSGYPSDKKVDDEGNKEDKDSDVESIAKELERKNLESFSYDKAANNGGAQESVEAEEKVDGEVDVESLAEQLYETKDLQDDDSRTIAKDMEISNSQEVPFGNQPVKAENDGIDSIDEKIKSLKESNNYLKKRLGKEI